MALVADSNGVERNTGWASRVSGAREPVIHHLSLNERWLAELVLREGSQNVSSAGSQEWPNREVLDVIRDGLIRLATDPASLPKFREIKSNHEGRVFRVEIPWMSAPVEVIGKEWVRRGTLKTWTPRVFGSRSRRDFQRGLTLLQSGVSVPQPLVLIERRGTPGHGILLTEYLTHAVELDRFVLTSLQGSSRNRGRHLRNATLEAVIELIASLHHARWSHRDFKSGNIMIEYRNEPGSSEIVRAFLVDLEGLRRPWLRSWNEPMWPAVVRLVASFLDRAGVSRSDAARLVKSYLGAVGREPTSWGARFGRLMHQAEHYQRRAKRRKVGKLDGYTIA